MFGVLHYWRTLAPTRLASGLVMWLASTNKMWVAMTYTTLSRCFKSHLMIYQFSFPCATRSHAPAAWVPEWWQHRTEPQCSLEGHVTWMRRKLSPRRWPKTRDRFPSCPRTEFNLLQFGRWGPEVDAALQERCCETLGRNSMWQPVSDFLTACVLSNKQHLTHSRYSTNICCINEWRPGFEGPEAYTYLGTFSKEKTPHY